MNYQDILLTVNLSCAEFGHLFGNFGKLKKKRKNMREKKEKERTITLLDFLVLGLLARTTFRVFC